jgi:hypothetical protein
MDEDPVIRAYTNPKNKQHKETARKKEEWAARRSRKGAYVVRRVSLETIEQSKGNHLACRSLPIDRDERNIPASITYKPACSLGSDGTIAVRYAKKEEEDQQTIYPCSA